MLECVLRTYLGSYQLVKHDRFWFWMGWITDYPQKMEVVTNYLTKLQYSYKKASISCFLYHGPQMLTNSVLMVLFEPLGHDYDPRYLKPTILAFLGTLRLSQNTQNTNH